MLLDPSDNAPNNAGIAKTTNFLQSLMESLLSSGFLLVKLEARVLQLCNGLPEREEIRQNIFTVSRLDDAGED
jgi:hypothetical protein